MEQDIKRLKEKIKNIKKYDTYRYDWTETDIQTVEHLIKAYKELEEKNKKKSIEIICYQEELENSIPVSLIKETIEKLDIKITYIESQYTNGGQNCNSNYLSALYQKQVLQELLEKRK